MSARIQKPAPAFNGIKAVVAGQFVDVSLSDYLGKWVILLFYPMDFTFVCPTEILAFNDALPSFAALDTVVLAVSTDSEYTHFAWSTTPRASGGLGPNLQLPLLADRAWTLARSYGVLLEEDGVALRGQFLIDPKGVLRQATINDLPVGRSVDEALRLVKAFRFTEEHGEVCPANWTEGSRTIKADPTGSLEYFANANANGANGAKRARED
ncbi:peroxiredoxin [Dentipellis sp. KUC8613]|nr:peroxiredoxin [Dentipellis sp. KUC8613]